MNLREMEKAATPVNGWPGYFVDRSGNVYSTIAWRGTSIRILSQHENRHGYLRVRFSKDGVRKSIYVHKLIAEHFLPPRPTPQHEIRHLNGNRQDNRRQNLAWGTRKENAADREAHGNTARGSKNGFAKLTESKVQRILTEYRKGDSTQELLAEKFDVDQTTIGKITRRVLWTHVSLTN